MATLYVMFLTVSIPITEPDLSSIQLCIDRRLEDSQYLLGAVEKHESRRSGLIQLFVRGTVMFAESTAAPRSESSMC